MRGVTATARPASSPAAPEPLSRRVSAAAASAATATSATPRNFAATMVFNPSASGGARSRVQSGAVDDGAGTEQAFWSPDDGLVEPVPVATDGRPTFRSDDLDFRPDRMFDQLRDELPNSEIVDFAITGAGDGAVVYDARLQSEQGGVLLVLLDGDGRILGAQGE